jgi:hypothetical protein
MIYPAKIAYYRVLYHLHHLLLHQNNSSPVIISGTTRGGTTWLMEQLYHKDMQVIWEPTKYETITRHCGETFAKALGVIPYIPENAVWDEAFAYFGQLLSGGIAEGINSTSHPLLLSNPFAKSRLLLKCCNINLLLPWLCRNFNIRPILLVRSPFAVIASQLRHPGFREIGTTHNLFALNQPKYQDIFLRYEAPIKAIRTQTEMLANWWAIQHVELLRYPEEERKWEVVYYEDLFEDTEVWINRLYDKYSISNQFDKHRSERPSSTSYFFIADSLKSEVSDRNQLNPGLISEVRNVMSQYNISRYSY